MADRWDIFAMVRLADFARALEEKPALSLDNFLLALVEQERPDLICTYRHLHSGAWRWPYGLGEHLGEAEALSPEAACSRPPIFAWSERGEKAVNES